MGWDSRDVSSLLRHSGEKKERKTYVKIRLWCSKFLDRLDVAGYSVRKKKPLRVMEIADCGKQIDAMHRWVRTLGSFSQRKRGDGCQADRKEKKVFRSSPKGDCDI